MKKYWLIKSEPLTYSIDNLKSDISTPWSGIRNYQARNFMRDQMSCGDMCLFYHSNTKSQNTGIVGLAEVDSLPYPDVTANDQSSKYFEQNKNVKWILVDIKFNKKFKKIITLKSLKDDPNLCTMLVVQKGSRLSIQSVSLVEFDYIMSLSRI